MTSKISPALKFVIISNLKAGAIQSRTGRSVITPAEYIAGNYGNGLRIDKRTRIINICPDYSYLSASYYCALLADARSQKSLPSITHIINAHWKRLHKDVLRNFDKTLQDPEIVQALEAIEDLSIYFGRSKNPKLHKFTQKLFDAFRLPAIKIRIGSTSGKPFIQDIKPLRTSDIEEDIGTFNNALDEFSGEVWNPESHKAASSKYWLAILHDPNEAYPPSNKKALSNFVRIGKKKGFYVELITKANIDSLLEFDALFIRETTAVDHHTYRFAEKARREDIAVIDDPVSILRCCNKVYLQEMLKSNNILTPPGQFIYRRQSKFPKFDESAFPKVLKIPDGSFSRGVHKVNSQRELETRARDMFKKSEIILLQDFIVSDYDWRIVIVGGRPLFACKYYMAKGHWQIYNHGEKQKADEGVATCVPLDEVPSFVLDAALKSCAIIGNGLYGADIKEVHGQALIIEINDNPNIDAGVEDLLMKDKLYEAIFDHFKMMVDEQ